jgi:hypothetical protein
MPVMNLSERKIIEAADNMPQREGRKFLCMGPYCWGTGKTAKEAVTNAKKNRIKIYEGKRGWWFILYDADVDLTVDDMGYLCYIRKEGVQPYIELARHNMSKESV